jgi:hypothetical protein
VPELPELPAEEPEPFCMHHAIDARICGGPHRVVFTDLGYEVLAPGEEPQGTLKAG